MRSVNHPHSALADFLDDPIMPYRLPDHVGRLPEALDVMPCYAMCQFAELGMWYLVRLSIDIRI